MKRLSHVVSVAQFPFARLTQRDLFEPAARPEQLLKSNPADRHDAGTAMIDALDQQIRRQRG